MSETTEYPGALDKALEGRQLEDISDSEQFPLILKTIGNLESALLIHMDNMKEELLAAIHANGKAK